MQKGNISVHTENIFPIIKKFLYSDHEIFLRELVSNATDATQKLKTLSSLGEAKGELGDLKIEMLLDETAKTITIRDRGIGMTAEEIDKYINQIAFSGAEEFVEKYKDKDGANIIGHFGLGFYSSFMVADKVEILTQSFREGTKAARWICTGSTEFTIEEAEKESRGTDIILHINAESEEFLSKFKIQQLLDKYCRFLPVEIEFDGKTINDTKPLWTRKPAEITEEEYKEFYHKLYPMAMDAPLFWIHLNVDYPFNLTGILYFPKVNTNIEIQRNKIQLYSNQVFVTEDVKDIVPEFLMLMHGVIDSPDIPLNVSRSSLQADGNVKKITSHITKKVADKLQELFNADRKAFEEKWDSIDLFAKFGAVSDEKFAEKSSGFILLKNVDGEYFTTAEYLEKVKPLQTDKDNKTVLLYAKDKNAQHAFIEAAKTRNYDVLLMDSPIDGHFISYLENKNDVKLTRVDSDAIDKLVDKGESRESVLNDEQVTGLKEAFKTEVNNSNWNIDAQPMNPDDRFITITLPEWERRMKEMGSMGGMAMFGAMPERYNVLVNSNHRLARRIADEADDTRKQELVRQSVDLAKLSQNLLTGQQLTDFIKRSEELMGS